MLRVAGVRVLLSFESCMHSKQPQLNDVSKVRESLLGIKILAPKKRLLARLRGRRLAKGRSQDASSYSYGCLDFDLSTAKLSDALRTPRPASPAPAGAPGAPRRAPGTRRRCLQRTAAQQTGGGGTGEALAEAKNTARVVN